MSHPLARPMQPYSFRRKMMRAWMSAALLSCALPAHAFIYTVNSTDDAVDADPSDGACATAADTCTLRAAIQQANAWPGHDTIVLPAGTYTLSIAGRGENAAAAGDLDITGDLTLRGAGAANTVIDAGGIDRVFDIFGQTTVIELSGIAIVNGVAQPQGSPADDGTGGGIRNRGLLTLRDAEIRGNSSEPSNPGFAGGGIHHTTPGADVSLLLQRVVVSDNLASGELSVAGGGIATLNSSARIERSIISGNSASSLLPPPQGGADGGGIAVGDGLFAMIDSTVSGNSADRRGGGMSTFGAGPSAVVDIQRSTISGNTAYMGGGIYDDGAPSRTLSIVNSTISGNTAAIPPGSGFTDGAFGGGLFLSRPSSLINVTIADNTAQGSGAIHLDTSGLGGPGGNQGSATIANSIIQAGSGGTCGGALANITATGPNLGSAECAGSLIADALLGPLAAAQGGPTAVHMPQAGSPAINAGSNAACPATDQRGFPRPIGNCDLGAVETGGGVLADLAVDVLDVPDPVAVNTDYSYVMTVTNQGPNGATGAQASLALPAGTTVAGLGGCASAGAAVNCALGALAAGDTLVRTVAVTANAEGTLLAEVSAGAAQNDPVAENSSGIEVVTQAYRPTDLVLVMSAETTGIVIPEEGGAETTGAIDEGDTIIAGQPFTYLLTLDNTGGTAHDTRIFTTLPLGIAPLGASFRIGAGTAVPCAVAAQEITCALGDLPEGDAVATISIPARPDERGTMVATATGNFDGAFSDAPPADSLSIEVDTRTDLAVAMAASANPVTQGADLGYIVTVSNAGPSNATAPAVSIALDASVDFQSSIAAGWNCAEAAGGVDCTRDSLAAGSDSVITLFVVPGAIGAIEAVATVTGDDTDPNPGNNSASVTTTVVTGAVNAPDLVAAIIANPNPGFVGENLSFVSTVTNMGDQVAGSVGLTQTLPAGATFLFATEGCQRTGSFVQCAMGTIIPGTSASVTVVVQPEATGSISTSIVTLDASGRDANLANNESSLSMQINQPTEGGGGLRTSGRCFIATAAWGSYLDPHVLELRRFRDDFLLTNAPGRAFVSWYYETSPPIAAVIADHEALRAATRWALTPLVYAVAYPLPAGGLVLLCAAGLLYRRARNDA